MTRPFTLSTSLAALVLSILSASHARSGDEKGAVVPALIIGKSAPDFELRDTNGKSLKLSAHTEKRGKNVLLVSLPPSCAASRRRTPSTSERTSRFSFSRPPRRRSSRSSASLSSCRSAYSSTRRPSSPRASVSLLRRSRRARSLPSSSTREVSSATSTETTARRIGSRRRSRRDLPRAKATTAP